MGHLGAFLFLLGALGALADICEIPEVDSHLVEKLGQHLLPSMDALSLEYLNPSIYVGLRLSSLQAETKENLYLHRLKLYHQQCLLESASSDDNSDCQTKPSRGHLALYLLALRANCEFVGGHKGARLVSQLKWFLEEEKRAIGHDHKGHPQTSYYQYSLSILALCVHQKRLHDSVVGKLLYAVEHDQHLQQGHLAVDTMAMAGLALTCLENSNLNPDQRQRITRAIRTARKKVLKAQTPEGHFGNVYSTPLALQLLMTSPMSRVELGTACLKARAALLASLQDGAFQNVLMISQLLPVLNNKTYVDLISPDCLAPRVTMRPATKPLSQTQVPEIISITLKVPSILPLYKQSISVFAGSSLEDVLKTAQELGEFTYRTRATLSGPYVISVMGKEAGDREFWQLLQAPDTPLLQGIADYRPKDGETIELRLIRW
ncbi:PREDICTED: transcobalamin-2 [Galeopterus variegatus]|uniref:Transcobalamin-2 n=1 Tax=Galeopterus variegatus TaxID=482537 RepID=A0ABM0QS81_GALVR|nr:PREDICTED: transcobalamin-2 [Galeopterus variegatus]XP_008571220.1 PREDICTED: transcobalamin-2 [Galeopterus variegatus]XP_008571221.1 PREDICTED: transcobalamin-2 [Galeopterus variegatus]XP_008571222.1 PREDICTED: transcobalamin-2 [Galeopterus variegatus]